MRRWGLLAIVLAAAALAGAAQAEVVQQGGLRIGVEAGVAPKLLPRETDAPVAVTFAIRIFPSADGQPPQLRRIRLALNRFGRLDREGLPVCRYGQLQSRDTEGALAACRPALVGEGRFTARVLIPDQSPFPSEGKVYIYNGSRRGRPALLAHVYGTKPAPTSFTVPFLISRAPGDGPFGTVLTASLGEVAGGIGYITSLRMRLWRRFVHAGERRSFISARCAAPRVDAGAIYPLARATLTFADREPIGGTLLRSCGVRR